MAELTAFGVNNLRGWNGTAVLDSVLKCAVASCQAHDRLLSNCSPDLWNLQQIDFDSSSSLLALQSALASYCDGMDVNVNADVAGPGVLISHIAQTLLVLLVYGLMNILNSWVYTLLVVGSTSGHGTFQSAAQHQQTLRHSAFNTALLSAAIEFQEAQAFFTAAIQIATLVTFKATCGPSCTALDTVSSISESIMNSQLVQVLAVNSVLPVLLMQSVLRRVGMGWWYTLILTLGNYILAIIIDNLESIAPTIETVWSHLRDTEKVQQCGHNPSLQAFCLTSIPQLIPRSFQSARIAYIYPVITILVVNQILLHIGESKVTRGLCGIPFVNARRLRWTKRIVRLLWGFVEFLVMVNLAVHAWTLRNIAEELGITAWNQWSYGQVVASMVWAPILGKLLYYNSEECLPVHRNIPTDYGDGIVGVKRAFDAHLLKKLEAGETMSLKSDSTSSNIPV
ncbi:hypothetical protein QBC41DRAFT_235708 [Cercophora samala]|uniref:Uncharacterized protein n=1 Tax=Cercophora samala TaxID=330535 RepID=A0AA39YZX8_9PEZI|nr:hypothetical protein QBC41DRAFT_235708 [Cercophora samala]